MAMVLKSEHGVMLMTSLIVLFVVSKIDQTIALQLFNLTKRYDRLTAVNNLSFKIYKNEIFGLLGPNGAGKTTTINMICGLLAPSDGIIKFTGYEGLNYKSVIGYCTQENIFYPRLTCIEQLIFAGRIYGISSKIIKTRVYYIFFHPGDVYFRRDKFIEHSTG